MLRFLGKIYAKLSYVFSLEVEAGKSDLNAAVAARNAAEQRKLVATLKAEADGMDKRIAEMTRMEEDGFYLCDNGHEKGGAFQPGADGETRKCIECQAPAKFIKRSEMSGQEKYESDKERKDAEQMAADKRKLADEQEAKIADIEQNAKFLRGNAANARAFADKIREI